MFDIFFTFSGIIFIVLGVLGINELVSVDYMTFGIICICFGLHLILDVIDSHIPAKEKESNSKSDIEK